MPISDATREDAARLVARYPVSRSALLPLLHLVQAEEGYVSEDGIAFCAESLGLTKAEVGAVATFYTMYKREPFGNYLLSVCTNPTCKIAGADTIYASYTQACGGGHIDAEAGVMVEHAECLGICDAAPVVQINYEMYGPVTHDEAMELLDKAKAGDPPVSNWSGERPGTFREVQRQLSGIEDGTDEHLIEAARLQVTGSEVPPSYRTGEIDIPVTHPGGDQAGHGGEMFRTSSNVGDTRHQSKAADAVSAEDVPEDQLRIKEQLAESGVGVAAELAEQALGEPGVPQATPAAQEQPSLDDSSEVPQEAGDRPAAGSEADPDDSIAGEGGDESLDQPVSEADEPSERDSERGTGGSSDPANGEEA